MKPPPIFGILEAVLRLWHFVAATLCDSFSWKVDSLLNWRTASEVQQNLDNLEVGSVPYWTSHPTKKPDWSSTDPAPSPLR